MLKLYCLSKELFFHKLFFNLVNFIAFYSKIQILIFQLIIGFNGSALIAEKSKFFSISSSISPIKAIVSPLIK